MITNTIAPQRHDFSDISLAVEPYNILADHYGSDLAAKQLLLEHEAYAEGERRFHKNLQRQMERGELADNAVSKPLLSTLVPRIAEAMSNWREKVLADFKEKGGRLEVAYGLTENVDPQVAAVITLKTIMAKLVKPESSIFQHVASAIGRNIEDELRYGRIRQQEREHFERTIRENLNKRAGATYKKAYMQAVESSMLSEGSLKDVWGSWSPTDCIYVGTKLIALTIESTGLLKLERPYAGDTQRDAQFLTFTEEYAEMLSKRAYNLAGMAPVYQPCVVPPKPWTSIAGGGYWAKGRRPLPLIRLNSRSAMERYEHVAMPDVYASVNAIQNTAWKINRNVLKVVNEMSGWKHCPVDDIPQADPMKPEEYQGNPEDAEALKSWKRMAAGIYRKEKARQSRRLSMEFILQQANKFDQFKAIWFPYNMDWRGRVYAIPMFNPQGNDLQKGLLTLAKGKPIGKEGFYWLKIHGANCASQRLADGKKTDKSTFEQRIKWVEDNSQHIIESAKDPLGYTWWTEMDSPFCFLAFCFEYYGVMKHGLSYVSSLPIAFDGSCSGIQHFSAMLRDEVGGHAVNLTNSGQVQDIYDIVAQRVIEILKVDVVSGSENSVKILENKKTGEVTEKRILGSRTLAEQWLAFGVDRGVTKRSVMTLAYGSKEYGFADQVFEDTVMPAIDSGKGSMFVDPSQASRYMAHLIWEAVSKTVVAAVEAMKWLQSAAKLLAAEVKDKKTNTILKPCMPVRWVTPDGFPVWQEYRKKDTVRLDMMFMGSIRLQPTVNRGKKKELDKHKQESGIAPNFVHSQDGSHLRMTVLYAHRKYDIESFAVIHDSFGTIPADAGKLFKAVRETMVQTYEHNDVLQDFHDQFFDQLHESQLEKMPSIPKRGKLNIREILESDFAFA